MIVRIVVTVMVLFGVAGCGDDGPEPAGTNAEWKAAVEAREGHPVADWDAYQDVTNEACDDYETSDDWEIYVAVGIDSGVAASDLEEDVSYACPEDLDDLRKAIEGVQDNASNVEKACSLDPDVRTQEQQQLAEAMGC